MRRHAVLIAGTAVLAAGGVTALALTGTGTPRHVPSAPVAAGPIDGRVRTIALHRDGVSASVRSGSTKPFSLLGVVWDAPHARLAGKVRVRTRSAATGAWSGWRAVDARDDDTPDGTGHERSRRGATAPLWTGPSDGVEVRVAGHRALPAGLRVVLVDPGHKRRRTAHAAGRGPALMVPAADTSSAEPSSPPDSANPAPSVQPSTAPSEAPSATASAGPADSASPSSSGAVTQAPASTAPRPAIVSRAEWGADESLVTSPPSYGTAAKVVFVHHTDTANDYSCADSPAIVRSVFLYHVKTNGWDDIGYNFLVDKCGTLFEGRAGGVDRPVIGAHAYGFNTNSAGISVLGTYQSVAPSSAALATISRLAAWKLGLSGADPTGSTTLVEGVKDGNFTYGSNVTFKRVSGHRDANSTLCPGQLLYDKLGTIRTTAAQWTAPADLTSLSVGGATKVGSTYYTKGKVTVGWHPAAVTGYDLLDNGTVLAHAAGSAASVTATLAAGTHQVQVVAHDMDGTTAKSATLPVVADTTKPVFSGHAALSIRTGTVSSSKIPVRLRWKVTDNRLLRSVKATSPSAKTFGTTTTSWSSYAPYGISKLWSLTAADAAGNTATSSATRTAARRSDGSSTRTGTWKVAKSSGYIGGSAHYSRSKGATLSWKVTGRSAGIIDKRTSTSGKFYVYVDGKYAATIDTRASSTHYRRIQWTRAWSSRGTHTIKIKVAGTSGRPTVTIDGLAYIG